MRLTLERIQSDPDVTIGRLLVDGQWDCWTLEDPVRERYGAPVGAWKIPGQTAIPRGVYPLAITWSPRFRRDLPLLQYVPGFTGVRIHPGNTPRDTEGCILVGAERLPKSIARSREAFDQLMTDLLRAHEDGRSITIEVR